MGEIILKFDSETERVDAQTAMDGWKWKIAMWDLDQELRSTTKYGKSVINPGSEEASGLERDIADRYRDKIREIMNSRNIMFE